MINQKNPRFKELVGIGLIFFVGIFVEYLGVNYNLIFGDYEYGKNMGPKFFGVPFLIGVNWIIITLISAGVANTFFKKNKYLSIIIASVLMVFIYVNLYLSLLLYPSNLVTFSKRMKA